MFLFSVFFRWPRVDNFFMYIHLHTQTFFYVYVDRLLFYTSAMLQLYFRKKLENKRLHQNDNNSVVWYVFCLKKERSDQIRSKGIKVFKVCIGTFLNSTKNIFSYHAYDRALVMVCRPESINMKLSDHAVWQKKTSTDDQGHFGHHHLFALSEHHTCPLFSWWTFFLFLEEGGNNEVCNFLASSLPKICKKNPLTHKYYSPRSFFAIILPLKSLSWKNLI